MNGHTITDKKGEVIDSGKLFITSKGIALHLVGISPLLIAKLQSSGKLPPVPTRKVPLDFGDFTDGQEFQLEELTEKDLQDDEEKKEWDKYVAERDAVLAKRNEKFLKAVFAKGVNIDLSRIEGWKAEMAYFEIEVPEHPLDLKVEYIQTEAISSTTDMVDIITGVLGESGVPEEDLADVRAMFQRAVRRDTPAETIDSEGEVDMESDIYGDESGEGVGSVAPFGLLQGE